MKKTAPKKKPMVPDDLSGKSYPQLWKEYKALLDQYEKARHAAFDRWENTIGSKFESRLQAYRNRMDQLRYNRGTA